MALQQRVSRSAVRFCYNTRLSAGGYAVIAAIFPRVTGLILSSQRNAPEVTLWVYNGRRNAHRRIINFEGGGISWDRTNDLYDVNVAL